ncbi:MULTISPECIES: SDR family oxidoreductase [Bacillus]|uniref:3-oxoacyl-ACP reductase n=1 Tax=Bacillus gobiensis TaxID=1441095 RepID=A0A0M4FM93_9BACI|nr:MULTISPECIES: SDR family oxidoreductase [Bacillus]ALC83391.1 3-oxoacyl-ACP reductase [Bacillus gobiensis]
MKLNQQPVIMITGASKGLGYALLVAFAKQKARLAICARNSEKLEVAKIEAERLGAEVLAVTADVSNIRDVDRFVSLTEEAFGRIDVVINNASIFGPGPCLIADYPEDEFSNVIHVNVLNPFLVTKRVLPGMLIRNSGSIINITSEAGKTGFAEWGAYGISKFAVEGLTETLADELKETNIRVNMVDPGEMDTEMHHVAVPDCDYELARPEDITSVFLYLASLESEGEHGKRFEAQNFVFDRRASK